jgi:hypothetical protein
LAAVRDQRGIGWGTYQLVTADTGRLVAGDRRHGYGLTLSQVAEQLGHRPPTGNNGR